MLLFSASGVFAQLQSTMNKVWNVTPKPQNAIWDWLRKRLLSMGMVLSVAFILLASLVISAVIGMVLPGTGTLWNLVTAGVSMLVFIVLFAMIFKFLPDVQIAWRDVWVGAVLTAVLFTVGKYAIGVYIGNSAVASSYGTAGSLIALLVWVYYSAVIVLFGAELTQVYATRYGSGIQPEGGAVKKDSADTARGEAA
jgi:membrane protein